MRTRNRPQGDQGRQSSTGFKIIAAARISVASLRSVRPLEGNSYSGIVSMFSQLETRGSLLVFSECIHKRPAAVVAGLEAGRIQPA